MNHTLPRGTALLAICFVFFSCDDDVAEPPANGGGDTTPVSHILVEAFPGLRFVDPVDCQNAGDSRLFIVERAGRILVFDTTAPDTATVFLDISARVRSGGEMGLLGLAFHPDYLTNGYFYVNYTTGNPGLLTHVSRFSVTGDRDVADPTSEALLLEFAQPFGNHNGGGLEFGPGSGGYLFVAVGDGGSSGDPRDNGQDPTTLLGSILRLDVNANMGTPPYHGIPPDNPFVGNPDGWREEIYAYGMRNPWRISYDVPSGRLWAGDVGQGLWEEIDVIENGMNYGWDCFEGMNSYINASAACTLAVSAYTDPVWEYSHAGSSKSVTGGYVYRGLTATELTGKYIYADYVTGVVWALTYDGVGPAQNEELIDSNLNFSTFGVGADGELYAVHLSTAGVLYRLEEVVEPAP